MIFAEYAWGAGHNLALLDLVNVEADVMPHNKRGDWDYPHSVGIVSQPVNDFPVRGLVLSRRTRGDGYPDHEWEMTLAVGGSAYIINTYLSGGAVLSVPMTISTRNHARGIYERYNCYLNLPEWDDDPYQGSGIIKVKWKFTGLDKLDD